MRSPGLEAVIAAAIVGYWPAGGPYRRGACSVASPSVGVEWQPLAQSQPAQPDEKAGREPGQPVRRPESMAPAFGRRVGRRAAAKSALRRRRP